MENKKNISKILLILIILLGSIVFSNYQVKAIETQKVYESLLTNNEQEDSEGNVTYAQYVTKSMSNTSYWKSRTQSVNKVLMTIDEIKDLNQAIIDGSGTNVFDLESIETPKLVKIDKFEKDGKLRQLYIGVTPINQQEYLTKYEEALSTSTYPDGTGRGEKVFYAVAVKRADMKAWPTDDLIGYYDTDPDDEAESYAINVNEPVVIRDVCNVDGKTFYFCQANACTGWINAESLAIFETKEEWINAWKIDIAKKDFLVVLQDKITLEPSLSVPETSEVKLMLGTTLKLVPNDKIPENLGERGTWNNYVVYLPTRDENGKYVRQYALISEHYNVSAGFIPMTQANILDIAFTCLGDRYGWGAMLGAMDCSAYTKAIYQCFGLQLPRNTTWQQKTPGKLTDISSLTDEQKQKYLETIPVGSLLYFTGHTMVYIGSDKGRAYAISATGSLSDSDGEVKIKSMYSVIINPLTTRRTNKRTWLNNITAVVSFATPEFIHEHEFETINTKKATLSKNGSIEFKCKKCGKIETKTIAYPKTIKLKTKKYKYNGKVKRPEVVVIGSDGKTITSSNYKVTYSNKNSKKVGKYKVKITFKGANYKGTKTLTYEIKPRGTKLNSLTKGSKSFIAKWEKRKTQTTGYQIQYSTDSNFKNGNKTVKIENNKTTSTTVKKLKKNKKYYVRIRTYKKVQFNGKSKQIYSEWSEALNVKTKK